MIYLNEGYRGGATRFEELEVVGQLGKALVFEHTRFHEGTGRLRIFDKAADGQYLARDGHTPRSVANSVYFGAESAAFGRFAVCARGAIE